MTQLDLESSDSGSTRCPSSSSRVDSSEFLDNVLLHKQICKRWFLERISSKRADDVEIAVKGGKDGVVRFQFHVSPMFSPLS